MPLLGRTTFLLFSHSYVLRREDFAVRVSGSLYPDGTLNPGVSLRWARVAGIRDPTGFGCEKTTIEYDC